MREYKTKYGKDIMVKIIKSYLTFCGQLYLRTRIHEQTTLIHSGVFHI